MAETSPAARTPYTPDEPKASLVSNILAIVGFIILIVVVIWGLVHLASLSRGWFSSLFGSDSAIVVSAPLSATSGTPFNVTWEYDEPTEGSYSLLYPCEDGFQFQTPGPSGVMNGIPCGAAFTVGNEDKAISVLPLLARTDALSVPISILFMPMATGTEAQGSATVLINPGATVQPGPAPAPAPTPTPSPSPTPSYSPQPSAPTSPADLSVRINYASIDASGNGVVTFDIVNVGGSSSGTYYFTAQLPTQTGYSYVSPAQTFLTSGARVANTLRFTGARSGVVSVSITTEDVNNGNNYASQAISGNYYNYDYGYPYETYPYQYQSPMYLYMYPNYQYSPMYEQYSPYSSFAPYTY